MKASASKTSLLMKCQFWARDDVEWPNEKPSAAAARGTKVHKLIADNVNKGELPSFDVDDWALRRAMQGIKIASLRPNRTAEVGYAMGQDSTAVLGTDVVRDAYPKESFCGTADLVYDDNGVHIRDWKTGAPSDGEEWQLRALAAMLFEATCTQVDSAKAIYLMEPAPRFGQNVLEGTDPKEDAATIRKHLAMIPDSAPAPGSHCKGLWCPIRKTCKAVV